MRGYAAEARRRTDTDLGAGEVDAYWREEALRYIKSNPVAVVASMGRKALEFAAHTEVANNRSLTDERLFSPVLRSLPSPFGWLFALGIPGLLLLAWQDRRGWLILAPLAVVILTFSVFFAEARFRFHAVPLLALGSGVLTDQLLTLLRTARHKSLALLGAMVLLFAAVSAWATRQVPDSGISWDAIAWVTCRLPNRLSSLNILAWRSRTSGKKRWGCCTGARVTLLRRQIITAGRPSLTRRHTWPISTLRLPCSAPATSQAPGATFRSLSRLRACRNTSPCNNPWDLNSPFFSDPRQCTLESNTLALKLASGRSEPVTEYVFVIAGVLAAISAGGIAATLLLIALGKLKS